MIYEQRVYCSMPGRLPDLLQRFETVTLPLWERHGIRQAGFWTNLVGPNSMELLYLLAWESMAEREKKWSAFSADPDWVTARIASEKDGPIIASAANRFLQPTRFSAVR